MIIRLKANKPSTASSGIITAADFADRDGFVAKSTDLGATLIQLDTGQVFRVVATPPLNPTTLINASPTPFPFVVGVDPTRYLYTDVPSAVAAAGVELTATGIPQQVYLTSPPVGLPWQLGELLLPNNVSLLGPCGHRWSSAGSAQCQGRIIIGEGDDAATDGGSSICDLTIDNRGTAQEGAIDVDLPGPVDVVIQRCRLRTDLGSAINVSAGSIGLWLDDSLIESNDPANPAVNFSFISNPQGFPFAIVHNNNLQNQGGGRALFCDGSTWISSAGSYATTPAIPPVSIDFSALTCLGDTFSGNTVTAIDTVNSTISIIQECLFNQSGPNVIDGITTTVRWYTGLFGFTLVSPSVAAALTSVPLQLQAGSVVAFP